MSCFFGISKSGGARIHLLGHGLTNCAQQRHISVTASLQGKRNFRKFFMGNKKGTKLFRRDQYLGKYDEYAPIYTEVKDIGFTYDGVRHIVPEMVPEIVVPDLTDFQLKPYVSYRTADIYQAEFTAQDLFDVTYAQKITRDFRENKLDEHGNALEPSEAEKLTPEEAWIKARQTGSDIFSERIPRQWECLEQNLVDTPTPLLQVSSDDISHPSEAKKKLQQSQDVQQEELLSPPSKVASISSK